LKIELVQTCEACPEQYEAFHKEKEVGYLRLRHGNFTVECEGKLVYHCYPLGDGSFNDSERKYYLKKAKKAIKKYYAN